MQLAGSRILPSHANLSVAGNQVDLQGSFGAPGDRLRFRVDAPRSSASASASPGSSQADGDLTGSFAHPNVVLNYQADSVVFGSNRIGHAEGHAELRDGANGALVFTTDARDLERGRRRSRHAHAQSDRHARQSHARRRRDRQAAGPPLEPRRSRANGKLTEARDGTRWDGTITRLHEPGHAGVESRVAARRERRPEPPDARRDAARRSKARC